MELDELCVFNSNRSIASPIGSAAREQIERRVAVNVAHYGKAPQFKWGTKPGEEFVRINIEPFVLDLVFLQTKVELYGSAPTWAKLLFTKARREELASTAEKVLKESGFDIVRDEPEKSKGGGWAARRANKAKS